MSRHPFVPRSTPSRAGGRRFVRRLIMVMALVAVALAAAAGAAGTAGGHQQAATPKKGGTLKLLGSSDIFNLDPVSAYYTVSTLLGAEFTGSSSGTPTRRRSSRRRGSSPTSQPPCRRGQRHQRRGKTYTFHLRKGVMWNSSPARQVTAGDFVREFKVLCNPASPVGAPGYYTSTIVGMAKYCAAIGKVKATAPAISGYANSHPLAGVIAQGRPDAGVQARRPRRTS